MATIRKRNNGTFQIVVLIGIDNNNKMIRKYATFTPTKKKESAIKKEVQEFAITFENECKKGLHPQNENMKFIDYSRRFLENYCKQNLSEGEQERYQYELEKFFYPTLSNMKMKDIKTIHIQSIFNEMACKYASASIKKTKSVINKLLNEAVREDIILVNPCSKCITPKKEQKYKVQNFTKEQAETFLQALSLEYPITFKSHESHNKITKEVQTISEYTTYKTVSLEWKAFFYLALFSGLRKQELLALTWNDIDFNTHVINVNKAVKTSKKSISYIGTTKTQNSIRKITVPIQCINVLKAWKEEQKKLSASDSTRKHSNEQDEQWVFTNENMNRIHTDTPLKKFHHIITDFNNLVESKAIESNSEEERNFILSKKLPMISLHDLRHTNATLLISEGVDIKTVSERLGHASASITLDIYTHALKEKDIEASNKLELMFQ